MIGLFALRRLNRSASSFDGTATWTSSPRAVIAGISAGTVVLAKAGLLARHRYATPFPAETREFLPVFPKERLEPGPVVSDGRRLTAHGC